MQVELALEVEFSVPNLIRKRFVRKTATIKPNKHRGRNALTRAIFEDKNLSTKNIANAVSAQKVSVIYHLWRDSGDAFARSSRRTPFQGYSDMKIVNPYPARTH